MGIVVMTMKCSSVCVPMCIVLKSISDFPQGGFRVVTGGIRALVYKAREQDTLEPNERIHRK